MRWKLLLLIPMFLFICLVIPAQAGVSVGDPAPDFTLEDVNRNPHSLSDYTGKVVLIFFFQAW